MEEQSVELEPTAGQDTEFVYQLLNEQEDAENEYNVLYGDDSQMIYLQDSQGQYFIPAIGQTLLVQQDDCDQAERQVIVKNEDEIVVERDPEETDQLVQVMDSATGDQIICYASQLDENGQYVSPDLAQEVGGGNEETSATDEGANLEVPVEYIDYASLGLGPAEGYQYAILKDGKLFLPDGQMEAENVQMETMEATEREDQSAMDVSKIRGRNLITGQAVTLDGYMEKVRSDNFSLQISADAQKQAPQDVAANRTVVCKGGNGKKMVGRILQIIHPNESGSSNGNSNSESGPMSEEKIEPSEDEPVLAEQQLVMSQEHFDSTIANMLIRLMKMEAVRNKIGGKNITVKLTEKKLPPNSDIYKRSISYIYGFMQDSTPDGASRNWTFKQHDQEEHISSVIVNIVVITDRDGKNTMRVSMSEPSSKNKKKRCDICNGPFPTRLLMMKHRRRHFRSNNAFRCEVCSTPFQNTAHLQVHMLVSGHGSKDSPCDYAGEVQKHYCIVCRKGFPNESIFNLHCCYGKQYVCNTCGHEFSRYSNLVRHLEVHRNTGGDVHLCHVCGCSFSFASSLTRHMVQKHIDQVNGQRR